MKIKFITKLNLIVLAIIGIGLVIGSSMWLGAYVARNNDARFINDAGVCICGVCSSQTGTGDFGNNVLTCNSLSINMMPKYKAALAAILDGIGVASLIGAYKIGVRLERKKQTKPI